MSETDKGLIWMIVWIAMLVFFIAFVIVAIVSCTPPKPEPPKTVVSRQKQIQIDIKNNKRGDGINCLVIGKGELE